MDVDPTVVIPAILFTVVAIYVASSLLSKKPDASSSSSAGNKKPKVGYGDDIPPSRALTRPEPPAPFVEDIGAAERIQDVPDSRVKAVPVSASEPAQEPVKLSATVPQPVKAPEPVPEPFNVPEPLSAPEPVEAPELVPDPVTAQEVAAMPEPTPEPVSVPEPDPQPIPESAPFLETVPQSAAVPEPEPVLEPVHELVSITKSIPDPEQLVTSEPGPEAVPQPLDGSEKHNEESSPDVITDSTEDAPRTPAPVVEASPLPEVESEEEILHNNDEGAAEDNVMFAPGKKQSTFETLMTKEEMEEEQRVQREQLAAIFQLLRENQEALGGMTEGKMEEQLKLYSL